MPQKLSQKVVNTFIKGLITEAGELTFPEDASIDELNCLLERDGSRRRRLAVEVEDSNVLSTFTVNNDFEFTTGIWDNVSGQAGLEFFVVQNGVTIYFYNIASEPYSGNQKSFSVNMSTFEQVGSPGAGTVKVQLAAINGDLVVVSEAINPFYITYDPQADTIATAQINPRTRDFEWQGDTTTYSEEVASPSAGRIYDTTNAGWVGTKGDAALTAYQTANTAYPALTHPWYSGKDADGNFSEAEWQKVFSGTSLTGNGHFILDFFNKVRSGLTTETETTRFKTVAAFSGRVD